MVLREDEAAVLAWLRNGNMLGYLQVPPTEQARGELTQLSGNLVQEPLISADVAIDSAPLEVATGEQYWLFGEVFVEPGANRGARARELQIASHFPLASQTTFMVVDAFPRGWLDLQVRAESQVSMRCGLARTTLSRHETRASSPLVGLGTLVLPAIDENGSVLDRQPIDEVTEVHAGSVASFPLRDGEVVTGKLWRVVGSDSIQVATLVPREAKFSIPRLALDEGDCLIIEVGRRFEAAGVEYDQVTRFGPFTYLDDVVD